MKNLGKILAGLGILLVIYSIVGRFIGGTAIGMGILCLEAKSGLIMANSLMLIAIIIMLWKK